MRKFQYIRTRTNQFENVQAGSTALVNLPIGATYVDLDIEFSGINVADMTEIRVKINNEVRHRYSGTELNKIMQRQGFVDADQAGQITIPFVRYGLKTLEQEVITALVTGIADANGRIISQLSVEIDLKAGTTPALELFANVSDPVDTGPGAILSYVRDVVEANFTGEKAISNLVTRGDPKRILVNRHFLFVDENNVSRLRVRRNQFDIFDHTPKSIALEDVRMNQGGFSDMIVLDPTARRYGGNSWSVVDATDYRILLEMAVATPSIPVVSEFIGDLR